MLLHVHPFQLVKWLLGFINDTLLFLLLYQLTIQNAVEFAEF